MFSKFKSLPLSVRWAICFVFLIVTLGLLAVPQIVIPVLLIAGTVASLMRIFVYLVEERE